MVSQSSGHPSELERQELQILRAQLAEQQRLIDELTKSKEISVSNTAFDLHIDPELSLLQKPLSQIGIILFHCTELAEPLSQTKSAQALGENTAAVNIQSQSDLVSETEDLYCEPRPPAQLRELSRNSVTVHKKRNRRPWLDFRVSS